MRLRASVAAVAAFGAALVSAAPAGSGCNADNVLRLLRGKTEAPSFCSTYTTAAATAGQAYPTWLSAYTQSTSRISSACTCLGASSTSTPAPAPTSTTASSTGWDSYVPPSPTSTATISPSIPNPLPTIAAAPLALSTAAVSDSIPPAPTKEVYFGSLGNDEVTALIAHVSYEAPEGAPLVNLDDLIPGLDGFPTCGETTIGLTFIAAANRDLAVSEWTGANATLVTAGGNFCGDVGRHNFYKISSAVSSDANSVVLTVKKIDIQEALKTFDAAFGTFSISDPAPNTIRRSLEKRGGVSFASIWTQILSVITGNTSPRYTTPRWSYGWTFTNLFQLSRPGFSASVQCNSCGISGYIDLFGQISFDIWKREAFGLVLGFDLVNPTFNLDMGVAWNFAYSGSYEIPLIALVPWSVEIPGIFEVKPYAELIASIKLDVKSAFQIRGVGMSGTWDTLFIGYNLITKLPVVGGDVIPKFDVYEPYFNNGVSLYGLQEGSVTVWLGPRIGLDVNIFKIAHGSAKLEFQFPAVNAGVRVENNRALCPDARPSDQCVGLHADARIRGVASAGAGLEYITDVGVEYELFNYNLGTLVDQHFAVGL
ncbi:hypothetical protein DRE_04421 [Drechslerella stenobrocha 248]|uniref:DUF7029 domain-containing protein n=1 Tax=Drechslerella stenobrocha 248 TaxID=1043628 RepID=W7IB02_9PEZI|nr:hypothetical protein DRE_04421 [Drechslerella stenobrocha 248]